VSAFGHVMDCETCDRFLAAYIAAVRLYTTTVVNTQGLTGANLRLTSQEAERLRPACHDTNNALMTHLRQDYANPT
jgi:hypothetical protein